MTDVVYSIFIRITPVMNVLSVDWEFPFPLAGAAPPYLPFGQMPLFLLPQFGKFRPIVSDSDYEMSSVSELLLPSAN